MALGGRRVAPVRRWHGLPLARANRAGAKQRPRGPHEQRDYQPPVIRQAGAALAVSAFVLAATAGGFRVGLLLMIAVSAGALACILALPAHSLHDAHH